MGKSRLIKRDPITGEEIALVEKNVPAEPLYKSVVKKLKEVKEYPEQTYNALIEKMVETFKRHKERDQYDKFLHTIQKQKMKELWDNKEDEDWENV